MSLCDLNYDIKTRQVGRRGSMKRILLVLTALSMLALALSACGSDDGGDTETSSEPAATAPNPADESSPAETTKPSGEAERSVKVEIVDFLYDPEPAEVAVGGKVIWQNMDSAPHTATADDGSFDTGTLEEGKLKSESFKEAGTYSYFCEIHPTMKGTVEVVEPG
jgi:plastocyanin